MNDTQESIDTLARAILAAIGGAENIRSLTNCMTRLRVEMKERDDERLAALKGLDGVLGTNWSGEEFQIILGPGRVTKVRAAIDTLLAATRTTGTPTADTTLTTAGSHPPADEPTPFDGKALHERIRQKNATPVKLFFRKIAGIFLPLIPGFIACGLIQGLLSVIGKADPALSSLPAMQILAIAGQTIFFGMYLLIGRNASESFGGSPVLGGMLGMLTVSAHLADVTLFASPLVPGRGGIIAVLISGILSALLEKRIRRLVPEMFSLFLTPLFTFLIMTFLVILVVQPVGGFLSDTIGFLATGAVERGGAGAGFLLAGLWLPIVMLGVHQVFTPIHAELLARYGVTVLLPILAMAGAGQVGASLAVYTKTKNQRLRKVILSALPVGFLGIGEPLIYGVTLPLLRPFIAACIGGAFGGAVVAASAVGASAFGLSGLPLVLVTDNMPAYLLGLATAYTAGFIAARLIGFDDPEDETR